MRSLLSVSFKSRRAAGLRESARRGQNLGIKTGFSYSSGSVPYASSVFRAVRCVPGINGSAAMSGELRLDTSHCASEAPSCLHSGPASTIFHYEPLNRSPSGPNRQGQFWGFLPQNQLFERCYQRLIDRVGAAREVPRIRRLRSAQTTQFE